MKLKSQFQEATKSQTQCFFCKKVFEEGHSCQTKQNLDKITKGIVKYL